MSSGPHLTLSNFSIQQGFDAVIDSSMEYPLVSMNKILIRPGHIVDNVLKKYHSIIFENVFCRMKLLWKLFKLHQIKALILSLLSNVDAFSPMNNQKTTHSRATRSTHRYYLFEKYFIFYYKIKF